MGCTYYPNLDKKLHLKGPANDVLVFKKMLGELFAFPADNMTLLSEPEGEARGKNYLPKRWLSEQPHSHVALDDAREQGEMFINMLRENTGKTG